MVEIRSMIWSNDYCIEHLRWSNDYCIEHLNTLKKQRSNHIEE